MLDAITKHPHKRTFTNRHVFGDLSERDRVCAMDGKAASDSHLQIQQTRCQKQHSGKLEVCDSKWKVCDRFGTGAQD